MSQSRTPTQNPVNPTVESQVAPTTNNAISSTATLTLQMQPNNQQAQATSSVAPSVQQPVTTQDAHPTTAHPRPALRTPVPNYNAFVERNAEVLGYKKNKKNIWLAELGGVITVLSGGRVVKGKVDNCTAEKAFGYIGLGVGLGLLAKSFNNWLNERKIKRHMAHVVETQQAHYRTPNNR